MSSYYSKLLKSADSLKDGFGINHFWYHKITHSGNYSFFGTHEAWNEFCYDTPCFNKFKCLRDTASILPGLSLMKAGPKEGYKELLDLAWEKFGINYSINFTDQTNEGIEAFGFATRFNDEHAHERLLNKLSYLKAFIAFFKEKNAKALRVINENIIHLPTVFHQWHEFPNAVSLSFDSKKFLRHIGLGAILTLTQREKDIIKLIANGYPASYIAQQLHLSNRTIENYLATIKCKLVCTSKIQLIQIAQKISSTGFLDEIS